MSRRCDENGYITTTTEAEPIEYAPVRHGRWEVIGQPYMRKHFNPVCCSICKRRGYNTPYCPHCGAKMDEVEE